jgi:hypothetical protein
MSIRDILAETNVSYDQGQHAVYEDPLPGHEHRGYRHFNSLQYNYDRHRNSTASSNHANTIRRKRLMMQRRRRSGGTVGTMGTASGNEGYNEGDIDLELELELDMVLDFEHLENPRAAGSPPESPQWHMTSVELAKMEAENLKRTRLHVEGGGDGLGAVMTSGGGGGGGGMDDIRSTGSGGSGNSATTAHTISEPIHFTTKTSTLPNPASPSSAPASASPTPKALSPTTTATRVPKARAPTSGNLLRPLLGGTKFSRFSSGVHAVSFSDLPDQEFPWQRRASAPMTNPVIIYSPPPPEPGDDDYQSPPPKLQDAISTLSGGDDSGGVAVIPTKGRGATPQPLERFQTLSPAIMHLPPADDGVS